MEYLRAQLLTLCFILSIFQIDKIMGSYGIDFHCNTDDTQVYMSLWADKNAQCDFTKCGCQESLLWCYGSSQSLLWWAAHMHIHPLSSFSMFSSCPLLSLRHHLLDHHTFRNSSASLATISWNFGFGLLSCRSLASPCVSACLWIMSLFYSRLSFLESYPINLCACAVCAPARSPFLRKSRGSGDFNKYYRSISFVILFKAKFL